MKVVLPLRAEFGMKVWWHAPAVHAIPDEKVVCVEPGDEALYPSAIDHYVVDRQADDLRRNRYARDAAYVARVRDEIQGALGGRAHGVVEFVEPDVGWPRERFVPRPHEPQLDWDGVAPFDVVVCPRRRNYGAEKNWPEWFDLTRRLEAAGFETFAAGARDSSYDVPAAARAWDYGRPLDATIEALRRARLVVATDAGVAHLAVLCGAPLLMLTHGPGLVAPGPVVDETGKHLEDRYWPVKIERYDEANHLGSPVELLHNTWYDPDRVLRAITERLER